MYMRTMVTRNIKKESLDAYPGLLDLGDRRVSRQNFSYIVSLPHTFARNYLNNTNKVHVKLSAEGALVLTPVKEKGEET